MACTMYVIDFIGLLGLVVAHDQDVVDSVLMGAALRLLRPMTIIRMS